MQLKWKIFLVSLALIMVAVSITAMAILWVSFSGEIDSLRSVAVEKNTTLATTLLNNFVFEKSENEYLVMGEEAFQEVCVETLKRNAQQNGDDLCVSAIYEANGEKGTQIIGEYRKEEYLERGDAFFKKEKPENDKVTTRVFKSGENSFLSVCLGTQSEEGQLFVYSVYDISSAFEKNHSRQLIAVAVSVGVSLVISLILLLITSALLRPLSKMNTTLRHIASGNYSERVKLGGGPEEREISENINLMAASVEEKIEQLESIANGRKRYIDSLAHEMKTPLTSILCFGDLLRIKRNVTDSERVEYSGIIVDEAKRMKGLSSKLLELACADSAELDMEKTSVLDLLHDAQSVIAPAMHARLINFRVSGEDGYILCDRELFKSLIYNLCDNAAKASEAGQVVYLKSRNAENGMIISVSDSGIGMTKEVLRKVTEPFYMADKSRSRKDGGAGLGLSLCVEIAKRHGARISAKSRPGVGTTMFITIPHYKEAQNEKA